MKTLVGKFFFIFFLISIKLSSQEFYVNTLIFGSGVYPTNSTVKLNVSNTSETTEATCPPTMITSEVYSDVAIDKFENLYYVTGSGLLYKKNKNDSSCQFLGDFTNSGINSLTADSGNFLYAIGGALNRLYRYDTISGTFSELGDIPANYTPTGDLFFYENRLFLTISTSTSVSTTSGLLEINMVNPSQSCPFMNIQLSNLYAAFSVDFGTYSKAYIISSAGPISTLYEVDMVNKQIGNPIRTYNQTIYGAASIYNLTSTNSTCLQTPLNVQETIKKDKYFNIINPAKTNIICKTNIDRQEITQIRLYDNSARLIKDFSNQNNLEKLDISNISDGIYLLTVATKKGETYTKKIIIKS